jgi:hypothetical protein
MADGPRRRQSRRIGAKRRKKPNQTPVLPARGPGASGRPGPGGLLGRLARQVPPRERPAIAVATGLP